MTIALVDRAIGAARWTGVSALMLALACPAHAEQGILVVSVRNAADQPMPNVQIGTQGDGSKVASDINGRARVRLAPQTRVGDIVTLQLVPPPLDLVLMSPYQGRTPVPSFENRSDNYVNALVIRRKDRQALENAAVLAAVASRSARTTAGSRPARVGALAQSPYFIKAVYQPQPALAPAPTPAPGRPLRLVDAETAERLGFTPAEIEGAMTRFSGDRLSWKATLLTAQFEFGNLDPFSTATAGTGQPDVEFGIGSWSFARNTLQPLLARMRAADPVRFDLVMADGAGSIARLIDAKGPAAGALAATEMVADRRVQEPWKSRFRRLGAVQAFQRIQFQALQPSVNKARDLTASLGFHSERGFAFVYDLLWNRGLSVLRPDRILPQLDAFRAQIGREPDEQERLLIVANMANASPIVARFPAIRARRLALATGRGRVFGQDIDLDDAGLGMRDLATGAPIPLQGDTAVLRRLADGWLPASTPAAPPNPTLQPTPIATPGTDAPLTFGSTIMTTDYIEHLPAQILQLVGAAFLVIASWATIHLARWLNLKNRALISAAFEDALQKSLIFGVQFANNEIRQSGLENIPVKSVALSMALEHLHEHFVDTLRLARVSDKLIEKALDRAYPAAVALVAASEATPPAVSPASASAS